MQTQQVTKWSLWLSIPILAKQWNTDFYAGIFVFKHFETAEDPNFAQKTEANWIAQFRVRLLRLFVPKGVKVEWFVELLGLQKRNAFQ